MKTSKNKRMKLSFLFSFCFSSFYFAVRRWAIGAVGRRTAVFSLANGDFDFVFCSFENFLGEDEKNVSFFFRTRKENSVDFLTLSFVSLGPGFCLLEFVVSFVEFSCLGFFNFHCFIKFDRKALLFTTPVKSEFSNSSKSELILSSSLGKERSCSQTRLSISVEANRPVSMFDRILLTINSVIP